MKVDRRVEVHCRRTSDRQAYVQPELRLIGTLAALTAAGSGPTTENTTGNPQNPCTGNKNTRVCL